MVRAPREGVKARVAGRRASWRRGVAAVEAASASNARPGSIRTLWPRIAPIRASDRHVHPDPCLARADPGAPGLPRPAWRAVVRAQCSGGGRLTCSGRYVGRGGRRLSDLRAEKASQGSNLVSVGSFVDRRPLGRVHHERRWSTEIGIIRVARDDVNVQVRQGVAERQQVEFRRAELGFDRSTDCHELCGERRQLVRTQVRELGNVTAPPEEERVATNRCRDSGMRHSSHRRRSAPRRGSCRDGLPHKLDSQPRCRLASTATTLRPTAATVA